MEEKKKKKGKNDRDRRGFGALVRGTRGRFIFRKTIYYNVVFPPMLIMLRVLNTKIRFLCSWYFQSYYRFIGTGGGRCCVRVIARNITSIIQFVISTASDKS